MKKIILGIHFSRLGNETHLQFFNNIAELIDRTGEATHGMPELTAMFRAVVKNEGEALDFISTSVLTRQLVAQDKVRSRIFCGFARTVGGYTDHYAEEMRNSALLIRNVLVHYGYVSQKPRDDKTAAINDIAREMAEPARAKALERLALASWLEKVVEANAAYETLNMGRYRETSMRTPYRMKPCRIESERIYRAMTAEIENQMLRGSAAPGMTKCIGEWNAIVTHFKSTLRRASGGGGEKEPV